MQSFKHLNINSTCFKDIVKVIAKYDWDVEGGGVDWLVEMLVSVMAGLFGLVIRKLKKLMETINFFHKKLFAMFLQ